MAPVFLGIKLSHTSPHLIPNHFQGILSEKLRLRAVSGFMWPIWGSTLGLFLCLRSLYTIGSNLSHYKLRFRGRGRFWNFV